MRNNYDKIIQLKCITCGDSNFEFNDDKSWIKCNRCNREYMDGYDELVSLNKSVIDSEINNLKNEASKDLQDDLQNILKKAVKGNKHIKFK